MLWQELLKAMSLTGGMALPTWALFYFIGTCLWAFYRAFPDPRVANLLPDAVFPNFILHELPPGAPHTPLHPSPSSTPPPPITPPVNLSCVSPPPPLSMHCWQTPDADDCMVFMHCKHAIHVDVWLSGIAGVVISGVLAAAMSTMDSSLNATASVMVIDFIQRCLLPHKTDRFYLHCARCVSLVAATLMICSALLLEYLPMESLNEW